jgi:hypothetical protein
MTDAAKFITNITRLNLLYQAAKLLLSQIDKGHLVDGHDFSRNRELIFPRGRSGR